MADWLLYRFYDLVLLIVASVWLPYDLLRGLRQGRRREGIWQRFGRYEKARFQAHTEAKVIWIHAVSVGETRAAIPLIRRLRQHWPQAKIVLSNVTETGHRVAIGLDDIDDAIYFPLDLSWIVSQVIHRIKPDLFLIVETEIWPNLIRELKRSRVPIVLVNGRFSDRSFPRYYRLKRILKPVLDDFSLFCMQSAQDARRIALLGAPAAKVVETGNMKFDQAAPTLPPVAALRQSYGLPETGLVWAVGSTHEKEDELIARVFRRLMLAEQQVTLILAPRHCQRCNDIGLLLRKYGFPYRLRSELESGQPPLASGEVLLVDTMGEMLQLYRAADFIFVGGSLVPVGGHNIIEAIMVERPVLWGPYMQNFKDMSRKVLARDAGISVQNVDELYDAVRQLIDRPEERQRIAHNGLSILQDNIGATERTLERIIPLLGDTRH